MYFILKVNMIHTQLKLITENKLNNYLFFFVLTFWLL